MKQLERFELLIGKDNLNKVINKTILIIGLGGVGSYALESLVRSGIKKLIIVDYDRIDITNLNRQLMTNRNNIDKFKVEIWKQRIDKINPDCEVIGINKKIDLSNINELFQYKIDYVVDACDTIEVKKELIRICISKGIKLISSMGTGNKMDPSKLEIKDIQKTEYDPIAKIIRKMVRDEKIKKKIMVVCSNETPRNNNSKIIASNSFVPATAGLLCTSYIINDIIEQGDNSDN